MNKKIDIFRLTDAERDQFKLELERIPYDPNGHCQFINELRYIAMKSLPREILVALIKQKASLSPLPFLTIENLPTDTWVTKVPRQNESVIDHKSGSVSENAILAIASIIGEPYSIGFEGLEIVNNLIPSKETARDFTGLGSEVELDFHIENAALKYLSGANFSPLGLLLTGVKHDPHGPRTLIADGRAALALLEKEDREVLSQPRFVVRVPHRWRSALKAGEDSTGPVSIIREDGGYPDLAVAFYSDIVRALDERAEQALKRFYARVKEVSVPFDVRPGSLIYIDNRFALHAREAFKPSFDAENRALRWVQRVFIAPNLWNHRNLIREKHRVFVPASATVSAV